MSQSEPINLVQALRNANIELRMRVHELERQVKAGDVMTYHGTACATCQMPARNCQCGPAAEFLAHFTRMPEEPNHPSLVDRAKNRLRRALREIL